MAETEIKLRFANSILRVSEGDEEILLEHEVPGGPHTIAYLAPDEIHQLVVALYGDDYATNQQPSSRDEEVRERLRKALDALEIAALGGYDEALMPEDLVANPYEDRGLVRVTRDISDEFDCHMTPEGIAFVRETIEETRAALAAQPETTSGGER